MNNIKKRRNIIWSKHHGRFPNVKGYAEPRRRLNKMMASRCRRWPLINAIVSVCRCLLSCSVGHPCLEHRCQSMLTEAVVALSRRHVAWPLETTASGRQWTGWAYAHPCVASTWVTSNDSGLPARPMFPAEKRTNTRVPMYLPMSWIFGGSLGDGRRHRGLD
jgi:hypothetical protein